MIQVVAGEIFHLYEENEKEVTKIAYDFFFGEENHENDLIAVDGCADEPIYISKKDIELGTIDGNCFVYFTKRMFEDARRNLHLLNGGVVPVLNESGEPVCLLKVKEQNTYFHDYKCINQPPDTRVFSLYDAVVLNNVTEYAFILLNDVLKDYKGLVICVGRNWEEFQCLFSDRDNIEYIESMEMLPPELFRYKLMHLMAFKSHMADWEERCNLGFFSYDEILMLVYLFSIRKSYGEKYPEKMFYLVNPVFTREGLMSVCDKVQLPYAYAEANGFIPVINLTDSDNSIYSDYAGEDIWSKFFVQPYGKEAEEWSEAKNVWEIPKGIITFPMRWLMGKIVDCKETQFVNTALYTNKRVRVEIDKVRKSVLPNPDRTIGVLIRGTDFTISHIAGHSIMASPEQVMEKIKEYEATGKYDEIYLSTEDEDILQKMKELCGNRLHYINQKRFKIRPGELLADQVKERENEGWLRGMEYLTTLQLLSECESFIASGWCCGTSCALNTGREHFQETYVFRLGSY